MSTNSQWRATTKRRSSRGDPGATGRLVFRVEHGWSGSTLIILGQKRFFGHSSHVKENPKNYGQEIAPRIIANLGRIGQFDMCYFFGQKRLHVMSTFHRCAVTVSISLVVHICIRYSYLLSRYYWFLIKPLKFDECSKRNYSSETFLSFFIHSAKSV